MASLHHNKNLTVTRTDETLACSACDWSQGVDTKASPSGGTMTDTVATGRTAQRHLKTHGATTVQADWSSQGTVYSSLMPVEEV